MYERETPMSICYDVLLSLTMIVTSDNPRIAEARSNPKQVLSVLYERS